MASNMNATKFVVLLILTGVACASVGARQLEGVSRETKLGISIPETTNGSGAALAVDVGSNRDGSGKGYGSGRSYSRGGSSP
ncbi:hypothetical protein AALP_AA2G020100 [Arabis alpina]|uniref:Glycine-rich protein n=1 Tax=Arabis alpina TaxID=50452 RepID=A0A087HES0_ARAAL|nr:hypothetical protein AALP_AA2G020100 [Arabis alpina]